MIESGKPLGTASGQPTRLAPLGSPMIRAAVTGLGAVSGFGRGVELFWDGLVAGRRAMRMRGELPSNGPLSLYDQVPLDAPERAAELALHAVEEARHDAGNPKIDAVIVGTTLGGIGGWLRAVRENGDAGSRWGWAGPAQKIAHAVGAKGPVQTRSVACASGNVALGAALDLIRNGVEVVLAGGVDALNDFVVAGFGTLKAGDPEPCRPFDKSRRGLNLGEGAGFLLLESEAHARARGARIRAFLDGYGVSADAVHMTGPDREGRGAARAMLAALADARMSPSEIGFVSAHGTATAFNDLMEAKAMAQVFSAVPPVNSIKSAIGHTLGAAGALEAVLCVRTLETGLVTPTSGLVEQDPEIALDVVRELRKIDLRTVLSTSSGFGGTNAAIVLKSGLP
jgi:3-oxoacyl-[acyl-carrier-protein] synthase II